jgi:hypothetical protein
MRLRLRAEMVQSETLTKGPSWPQVIGGFSFLAGCGKTRVFEFGFEGVRLQPHRKSPLSCCRSCSDFENMRHRFLV